MTPGIYRLTTEVIRIFLVAAVVEVGLRITKLPRVADWCGIRLDLTSGDSLEAPPVVLPRRAETNIDALHHVMRHWPFGDTCLRRCLVLGQRLRHLDPVLRIGVAVGPNGSYSAHSWLEIGGRSLDVQAEKYARFGDDG